MRLVRYRGRTDTQRQLFIPGQRLFIPRRLKFISGNGLFISGLLLAQSVVFENQRHLRAGSHPVAGQLLVLGAHLVLFEDRITRVVDREKIRVDGVALGVAHAFGLFETNPHEVSSLPGINRPSVEDRRRAGPAAVDPCDTCDIGVPTAIGADEVPAAAVVRKDRQAESP